MTHVFDDEAIINAFYSDYIPKKYYKNVEYITTLGTSQDNFLHDFLDFSVLVNKNINDANLSICTMKKYKGILRNALGIGNMVKYLISINKIPDRWERLWYRPEYAFELKTNLKIIYEF